MGVGTNVTVLREATTEHEMGPEGFGADLPGGLPVYQNPTIEGVESTWTDLDASSDRLHFKRGAVAHVVSKRRIYGQGDLREFAARMGADYSTVCEWMATYRRLMGLPDEARIRVLNLNLRYSHYRALNALKDDASYEALLLQAHKRHWNVGKLTDALYQKRQGEAAWSLAYEESQSYTAPITDEIGKPVEAEAPPMPQTVAPDELADVGPAYERDVLERFAAWLADHGYVLADGDGVVDPFWDVIERYARELL